MIKIFLLSACLLINAACIYSQDINLILKQVSGNNPEILAYKKLLEARRSEAVTDLTPPDPVFSFGYMPGNNELSGTKKIWSVNQSFSFPSKYLHQKRISRSTIILAEQEFNLGKLNILLDAKLALLDLIYKKKSLVLLRERKEGYDTLVKAWKTLVIHGGGTITDFNKIIMEVSSLDLKINRTEADISMLVNRLNYLKGNNDFLPDTLTYPDFRDVDAETLISEKILGHPSFIIPEKEYLIRKGEAGLSRTANLPEFQAGYSAEILPGETFAGPVAGLTIPLWANANKIKSASAKEVYSSVMRDAVLAKLKSEVINESQNLKALKKSIYDLSSILKSGDNKRYLDLALSSGEISITTYFSDLGIMNEIEDRLLELENEYQKSAASLFDHELLK